MFHLLFLLFHLIHGRDLSLQKVGSSTKNYFLPSTWQASLQQNRNINTINIRTSSTLTRSPSSAMSPPSLPSTWSWSSPATTSPLSLSMAFLQTANSTLHASQVISWHESCSFTLFIFILTPQVSRMLEQCNFPFPQGGGEHIPVSCIWENGNKTPFNWISR